MREQRVKRRERGGAISLGELPRLTVVVAIHAGDLQASRQRRPRVRVADVAGADQADVHTVNPSDSRYWLAITADAFVDRALSGPASSSTTGPAGHFTSVGAANTPFTSTLPRPISTKRYDRIGSPVLPGSGLCTSLMCRNRMRSANFRTARTGSPPPCW